MACESCRSQARLLVRAAVRASRAPAPTTGLPKRTLTTLAGNGSTSSNYKPAAPGGRAGAQTRELSSSAPRAMTNPLARGPKGAYFVVGATERLYKVCGEAADYRITDAERKKDRVAKLEDGEEVGHSTGTRDVWHKRTFNYSIPSPPGDDVCMLWKKATLANPAQIAVFKLPPTFSTWSHVTMLHLYLLNARIRCFDRDTYANWRQQLVDHFFFEAEKKMHVDHSITSSALRQRYLKDIFVQWRGLLVAYDEGLVRGDAVLASAVWRNLFKGSPDVDPRALAAIVGWMRACLKALEGTSDMSFASRAGGILELPVESFWTGMEKATKAEQQESAAAAATGGGSKAGDKGKV